MLSTDSSTESHVLVAEGAPRVSDDHRHTTVSVEAPEHLAHVRGVPVPRGAVVPDPYIEDRPGPLEVEDLGLLAQSYLGPPPIPAGSIRQRRLALGWPGRVSAAAAKHGQRGPKRRWWADLFGFSWHWQSGPQLTLSVKGAL